MVWIIAAVLAVALFALAWWTSGRSRGGPERQRSIDMGTAEAKARSQINGSFGGRNRNV